MKLLLFSLLFIYFTFSSCQSEYDKQFKVAQSLSEEKVAIEMMLETSTHDPQSLTKAVVKLNKQISDCAHLSGNKRVFLQELSDYNTNYVATLKANNRLITKYP